MKIKNWRYWLCQVGGWGSWCLFGLYLTFVVYEESFARMYSNGPAQLDLAKNKYLISLAITFVSAILVTHTLRFILKKIDWLKYSFNNLIFIFLIGSITAGFGLYFISDQVEKKANVSLDSYIMNIRLEKAKQMESESSLGQVDYYTKDKDQLSIADKNTINAIKQNTGWERNKKGIWNYKSRSNLGIIYQTIILTSIWLLIYFIWHYVERSRKDQIDRIKLESTVKELELKTIKAHINPHFIFNSLNSIRALVDENPKRARTAITELSNLLRSSMQAEKTETVPLEKELKIVSDYLALEKIRFEDRLELVMHVEEDTMEQQVPPMMVQTLVENAIKHGISKQMKGGTVTIYSDFINSHYELRVENTGTLQQEKEIDQEGFGLKSTQDRLKLLYGNNTSFSITQKSDNIVSVKITLPVKIN